MRKTLLLLIAFALIIAFPAYADAYPESEHPYGDDMDYTWVYRAVAGTERMDVTFSDLTSVEEDFDYIYLLNKNGGVLGSYTGTELAGQTITVEGDAFSVQLISDESSDGDFYGFAVTNVVEYGVEPVTITSVEPDKATADQGDSVTWTVTAEGSSTPFTYVYQLLKDGEVLSTSNATSQATFTAKLQANGVYTLSVTATDAKGSADTFTGGDVVVDTLEIQSVTASETLVKAGLPMTWTVTADGGVHPYSYAYKLYDSTDTLIEEQDYSPSSTYTKTLKKLDSFHLEATVQDARGDTVTMTGDTVTLYKTLAVGSITADITSALAGDVVTWTATITGGKGVVNCTYDIFCDDVLQTSLAYDDVASIQYAPLTAGRYTCSITCVDEEDTVITKTSGSVQVTDMAATDPSLFTYETTSGLYARITGYTGSASAIRIPDAINGYTINEIKASAFKNKGALRAVVIPDTVTSIGNEAYYGCTALVNIDLGQGVTSIGNSAFNGCSSLVSVHLPESLITLGSSVFRNCASLAFVNHPTSLTTAGQYCFLGTAMKRFTIDEGVTTIASNFFNGCTNITGFDFPSTLTGVGSYAFANNDRLTTITLPATVTALGASAFANCHYLSEANLPSTMTTIGNSAFSNCTRLTSIDLPASLTSLGNSAFYSCSALIEASFPNGLTSLGLDCFQGCTSLKEADLPDTVTTIGRECFYGCTALDYFHYPLGWTTVSGDGNGHNKIFYDCKALKSVTVPEGITAIPTNAFNGANYLTEIILPSTLTTISNSAFVNCVSLTEVNFPNALTSLGLNCFQGCTSLKEADLPDTVTTIGRESFYGCTSLEYFHYPLGWTTVSGDGNGHNKIFYNCKALKSITVPEGITAIPTNAFNGANYLTEIILPSTLTTINNSAFVNCVSLTEVDFPNGLTSLGMDCFQGCTSLKEADLPDTLTTIGKECFYGCTALEYFHYPLGWTTVTGDGNGHNKIFYNCSALPSITVPEGITAIPANAFNGANCLEEIILPDTLTSIGGSAFSYCTVLTEVELPNALTTIGNSAFVNCVALDEINFPDGLTSLGLDCFQGCTSLKEADLPDTVTSIGRECFYGCTALEYFRYPLGWTTVTGDGNGHNKIFCNCNALKSVTVPEGVTAIPANTFNGANCLEEVILPSTLKTIGNSAFVNCVSLTGIDFPDGLTSLGLDCFQGCTSLKEADLPDTVTTIGRECFYGCTALEYFHYPLGWTTVSGDGNGHNKILYNCNALASVTVPEGVNAIPTNAFNGANCLTEVLLPNTLKTIGNSAFNGCASLTEIVIPRSTTGIGSSAFSGCGALTTATIYPNVSSIGDKAFANTASGFVIRCYSGSTAETYANNNHFAVELLDGDWLNWRVTAEGCLYVYGEGPMANYASGGAPWADQADEIYSIRVGGGVTSIGNRAFEDLATVTRADIPSTVTGIGAYAFSGCIDLGQLFLDDTVTDIGTDAFRNCVKLDLVCFEGSTAHQYAAANDLNCELITITCMTGVTDLTLLKGTAVELPSPSFLIQPAGIMSTDKYITSNNTSVISVSGSALTAKANGTAIVTLQLIDHPGTTFEIEVTVVGKMNTLNLPSSLTTLESGALAGVAAERIALPASLSSIAADALTGSGNLKQLVVTNANLDLPAGLLDGCGDAVVICPKNSAAAADCARYGIPWLYSK